jgi:hypothetical protein
MGGLPVEFDSDQVILMQAVEVGVSRLPVPAGLPGGARKSVRAFDAGDIAEFEQGVDTRGDLVEGRADLGSPASLRRAPAALRSRPGVVSRRPTARQSQENAASKAGAVWVRSSTVSSTRVRGGSADGCRTR